MKFSLTINKQVFSQELKYSMLHQGGEKGKYCLRIEFADHGEDKRSGHVNIYFNDLWADKVLNLLQQEGGNNLILRREDFNEPDKLIIGGNSEVTIPKLKIYLQPQTKSRNST